VALPTEVVKPLRGVANHEIWHGRVLSHLRGGTSVGPSLDLGRRESFCAWRLSVKDCCTVPVRRGIPSRFAVIWGTRSDVVRGTSGAHQREICPEALRTAEISASYCQDLWIKIFKLLPARRSRRAFR
jgi:hypothetical protein